jgi:hypothetical protein
MNLTRADLNKLALPMLICVALIASGIALIWGAGQSKLRAGQELGVAQKQRAEDSERLARIAEEEREVKEKLEVYQQLKRLNIVGDERRLEWADAMNRIRADRELLDLRYRVERQRLLVSLPGKPGNVDFYASPMDVQLALLHEEDLLRFLGDLRASGNAYYSVKRCEMTRTGQAATGAGLTPRLRAECKIDLITVQDRGAKK